MLKNKDGKKIVKCKNCEKDFELTKENTKCSFCHTEYGENDEKETEEAKPEEIEEAKEVYVKPFSEFAAIMKNKMEQKREDKQEDKEEKEEEKISTRKFKEFSQFAEKMKEEIPGNFRQQAESIGVLPEDVKDFKYWLAGNRE
ncbi:hypothetical protein COB55_01420 [Candidatus Wolfebacteria bacterium]|nr:MAG: hypothetical protein COB55_01420 [Candidatus Wolfebacteria bacterium]